MNAQENSGPISRRVADWPARLDGYLASVRARPFSWGEHDCCLHVFGGISAIIGVDPMKYVFRVSYRGALAAARLVRKHGGVEAIAERTSEALGFSECAVLSARRGDVLLLDTAHGPALGLCAGERAVFAGPSGAVSVARDKCRRAWRVE